MKNLYLLIILGLGFLTSCMTGKNSLENGNYDQAVYRAVKKLQNKPDNKKAQEVLQEAYNLAIETHFSAIEYHDLSASDQKWSQMADQYRSINNLNNAIMRYPQYKSLLTLVDVKEELSMVKAEASKIHFSRGIALLKSGTKQQAREAYAEFNSAAYFNPSDQNIEQKIREAREAGTMNIAIEFPTQAKFNSMLSINDLYYSILNESRAIPYKFMRIVDVNDDRFSIDEIIRLEMDQLFVGPVHIQEYREKLVKENIVIGEAWLNDSTKVDVIGNAIAEFRQYTKTMQSSGTMMMQRIDPETGAIMNQSRIPASYQWTTSWGDFRGDERALNQEQINIVYANEVFPPNSDWMFAQLQRPFFSESTRILRDTYSYLR